MSIGIPKLTDGTYDFRITNDQASWLATMLSIGSWLGDVLGYLLINRFGKKNLIFATTIPLVISWIMTTAATSAPYMFVGKFIAGMADGVLFTTVPTFMAEISDPQIRGILGSTYSVTLVLGMLIMNILMYLLPIRTAGYVATALNIPLLLTFPFLPDSAYFYLMKKNPDAAKASLQKYRGRGDVDEDLTRISNAVKEEMENEGGVLDIFRNPTYRKALLIAMALCILNQFTGINAILMFCTTVFEESKSVMDPELSNIIFFIVYFIAVTIAACIVDKYGRRSLLLTSSCGALVCLIAISTFLMLKQYSVVNFGHLEYIELVVLLFHIAFYAFGLNSIPILVASEIFTPNMKGIGLCLVNISYSISATLVVKYFTWTSDGVGMYLPFYTFAFWVLVAIVFAKFYLLETKGRTLEEIQSCLRGDEQGTTSANIDSKEKYIE